MSVVILVTITIAVFIIGAFIYLLLIRNRASNNERIWAPFFAKEEQEYFLNLVKEYFGKKNIDIAIHKGMVAIKNNDGLLGLDNLARMCHKEDKNKWEEIIIEHFNMLCAALKDEEKLIKELADFARAKDFLAVRIFPSEYLDSMEEEAKRNLIFRKDLEGTVTTLVFDLPSSLRTVCVNDTAEWKISTGELFLQALANVSKNHPPEISEIEFKKDVKATVFQGENALTASHILCLHEYRKCIGTFGSLVAIPHRHILICFPIEDVSIIDAINSIIPMVQNMHKEGPGSISPHIYWYFNGRFTHLPYFIWKERMDFYPPQEFVNILNTITKQEGNK